MTIPLFTPTLVNNTNPVDFLIYTYESANPGTTVASAFWGSISQAFMFGVIVVSASKYYWQYIGADGWINVTIVSILVAVTTADFIHHQSACFSLISHTDPTTGAGIATIYGEYVRDAFMESYMVAVTQPIVVGYFVGRCYGLWGKRRIILWLGGVAVVVMFIEGIVASTYSMNIINLKDGAPDPVWAFKNLEILLRDANRGYDMMSAWLLSSTIIDFIIAGALLAAMYKHQRTANDMRNMQGVRNALKRGMIYIIESMTLVVASQLAQTVILMSGLGLSKCLRAVIASRMPLGTFAVIWSLNSRAELKAMLDDRIDSGPISFSASGSFSKGKRSGSHDKSANESGSVASDSLELGVYGSRLHLVEAGAQEWVSATFNAAETRALTDVIGITDDKRGIDNRSSFELKRTTGERTQKSDMEDVERLRTYGHHFGARQ